MKFLAIDTATEACSAALYIDGRIDSIFEVCPQQHSQRILPMVDDLLKQASLTLGQLDGLGFGRGPGSFTGVRIATGMAQGLALGSQLPTVGVSTLAMMAQQAIEEHQAKLVAVAIDARMDEVYFALYAAVDGFATLVGEEQVIAPGLVAELLDVDVDFYVGTGWKAYPELQSLCPSSDELVIMYPNAAFQFAFVKNQLQQGKGVTAQQIQPVYLRDKVTWKKLPGR